MVQTNKEAFFVVHASGQGDLEVKITGSALMDRQAKIEKLKAQVDFVRIGGKGSARRKRKVLHKSTGMDERKVDATLKKLGVSSVSGIEEVNIFKDNGQVIHFKAPKVQASIEANIFAIAGPSQIRSISEMLPGVWSQLGLENFSNLKMMATSLGDAAKSASRSEELATAAGASGRASEALTRDNDGDDVPELVGNFDEA